MSTRTRVFISYAKEDKGVAEKLYSDLQQAGVKPWLDSMDLVPGQNWDATITKAISESRYFIALLSSRSVRKKGYVQKETRHALNIATEYPENEIYIIPVRIDDCESPFEGIRILHRADIFPDYEKCVKDLVRVFQYETEVKPALVKVDMGRKAGTITKLSDKGFGFIKKDEKDEKEKSIFFHHRELNDVHFDDLNEGDRVFFSIEESPKGQVAVFIYRA